MNVLVKEVPLTYKSLNSGDSFIFDGGDRIYVWHGRGDVVVCSVCLNCISESGPMEKAKAANIAQALDDERAGTPRRETFDEGLCNMREWWHALNGEAIDFFSFFRNQCHRVLFEPRTKLLTMMTSTLVFLF